MLLEQHFFLPSANFSQILCRNDSKKMRRKVLFSTIQLLYFFMSLSEKLTSSSNTISTKATLLEFCKRGRSTPVQTKRLFHNCRSTYKRCHCFIVQKLQLPPHFCPYFFKLFLLHAPTSKQNNFDDLCTVKGGGATCRNSGPK